MDSIGDMDTLRLDLERLSQMPTMPEFASQYLKVICEQIQQNNLNDDRQIVLAFQALITYELWHHKAMAKLASSPELQMRYLVPLGVEMRSALTELVHKIDFIVGFTPCKIAVKELLKAYCYYQLGETEAVVRSLSDAIAYGSKHPIISFALGYNRHRLALTIHAQWDPVGQRLIVTDKGEFERNMRQALDDFQNGLSLSGNEPFDGQLYFWMGLIYEILGERDNAITAYEKANELQPKIFSKEVSNRLQRLTQGYAPSDAEQELTKHKDSLPRIILSELTEGKLPFTKITGEEVEKLRQALDSVKTVSDFLRYIGGESEPASDN